jgi:hypothetical protein
MESKQKLSFECQVTMNSLIHCNQKTWWCDACQKHIYDFRLASHEDYTQVLEERKDEVCGIYNSDSNGNIFFLKKTTPIPFLKAVALAILLCFSTDLFSIPPTQEEQLKAVRNEWLHKDKQDDSVTVTVRLKLNRERLKNAVVKVNINDNPNVQEMTTDNRGNLYLRFAKTDEVKSIEIRVHDSQKPIRFTTKETLENLSRNPILVDLNLGNRRGKF